MRKRGKGLRWRSGAWEIDKRYRGARLFGTTGTTDREEAERILAARLADLDNRAEAAREREAAEQRREDARRLLGIERIRPDYSWEDAVEKYVRENGHLASLPDNVMHLRALDPYLCGRPLRKVHNAALAPFRADRETAGISPKSINLALGVVRRILNLAAREWIDPATDMTWLAEAPLIRLEPKSKVDRAAKLPYPLDWEEQHRLLRCLPTHVARATLFAINTGLREQELLSLRWAWERSIPELGGSVFVLPAETKNREPRVVVLNRVARSVVEACRGEHAEMVFSYQGSRLRTFNGSAWKRAWKEAGLDTNPRYLKGVHNLRHTFGRRLRAAGVPLETRRALLGHRNGDITTHYSAAELAELLNAVESIVERPGGTPLTVLKDALASRRPFNAGKVPASARDAS